MENIKDLKIFFEYLEVNGNGLDGAKITKEEEYLIGNFWKVKNEEWSGVLHGLNNIEKVLEKPKNETNKLPGQNERQAVQNMQQPRKTPANKEKRKEISPMQKKKEDDVKKSSPSKTVPKKEKNEELVGSENDLIVKFESIGMKK